MKCGSCGTRRIELSGTGADDVAYGAAYRAGVDPRKIDRLVELFAAHAPSPGALLDVGCSDGAFLSAARARGWSVSGVDADPNAVTAAQADDLDVAWGRVPDAPLARTYDAITLWDLIEHVTDPAATARWLRRACGPSGRVIVVTPDAGSAFDRVAAWERMLTRGRSSRIEQLCLNRYHLHRFTGSGLDRLFARAGFATRTLERIQLFSLAPARYLSGVAPGIPGFSRRPRLDALMSRAAFVGVTAFGITNKLLYVGSPR